MNELVRIGCPSGGLSTYVQKVGVLPGVDIVDERGLILTLNGDDTETTTTSPKSVGRVGCNVLLEDQTISRTHGFILVVRFGGVLYVLFTDAPARNKFAYGYVNGQLHPRKNACDPIVLPLRDPKSTFVIVLGQQVIGGQICDRHGIVDAKQFTFSVRECVARYLMEMQNETIMVPLPLQYTHTESYPHGVRGEPLVVWCVRDKRHYTLRRPSPLEGRFQFLNDFLLVITSSYHIQLVVNNGDRCRRIYLSNIDEISNLHKSICNENQ